MRARKLVFAMSLLCTVGSFTTLRAAEQGKLKTAERVLIPSAIRGAGYPVDGSPCAYGTTICSIPVGCNDADGDGIFQSYLPNPGPQVSSGTGGHVKSKWCFIIKSGTNDHSCNDPETTYAKFCE